MLRQLVAVQRGALELSRLDGGVQQLAQGSDGALAVVLASKIKRLHGVQFKAGLVGVRVAIECDPPHVVDVVVGSAGQPSAVVVAEPHALPVLELVAVGALAVVAVQQILKLNVIPVYFANKYPVVTNIALSIIAAVIVTWQTTINLVTWENWVVYVATISVLAAVTYNMTLRNSDGLQRISSDTEAKA